MNVMKAKPFNHVKDKCVHFSAFLCLLGVFLQKHANVCSFCKTHLCMCFRINHKRVWISDPRFLYYTGQK